MVSRVGYGSLASSAKPSRNKVAGSLCVAVRTQQALAVDTVRASRSVLHARVVTDRPNATVVLVVLWDGGESQSGAARLVAPRPFTETSLMTLNASFMPLPFVSGGVSGRLVTKIAANTNLAIWTWNCAYLQRRSHCPFLDRQAVGL